MPDTKVYQLIVTYSGLRGHQEMVLKEGDDYKEMEELLLYLTKHATENVSYSLREKNAASLY